MKKKRECSLYVTCVYKERPIRDGDTVLGPRGERNERTTYPDLNGEYLSSNWLDIYHKGPFKQEEKNEKKNEASKHYQGTTRSFSWGGEGGGPSGYPGRTTRGPTRGLPVLV